MSKHPIFDSILQQLHDDPSFSPDPFCALAEVTVLQHKAKKITKRELAMQTPDCVQSKLLIFFAALRAYQNRHLGTLMRCCASDSATSWLALLVKTSQHVKLRSPPSLARKQKKTLLWLGEGTANEHGAIRNKC